jgi:hypothetical protein
MHICSWELAISLLWEEIFSIWICRGACWLSLLNEWLLSYFLLLLLMNKSQHSSSQILPYNCSGIEWNLISTRSTHYKIFTTL